MGNDPRWVPPGSLVEVTCKVLHGLFLLRPSRDLNEIVEGILARAVSCYDVEVCAYVVLSNHMHMLLVPADAEQLALFMGYVNGNLAKEAGRLHRWREHFWGRRYSHVVVSDEPEDPEGRLRYLLEQAARRTSFNGPRTGRGPLRLEPFSPGKRFGVSGSIAPGSTRRDAAARGSGSTSSPRCSSSSSHRCQRKSQGFDWADEFTAGTGPV